jgi:hypothetical protein
VGWEKEVPGFDMFGTFRTGEANIFERRERVV